MRFFLQNISRLSSQLHASTATPFCGISLQRVAIAIDQSSIKHCFSGNRFSGTPTPTRLCEELGLDDHMLKESADRLYSSIREFLAKIQSKSQISQKDLEDGYKKAILMSCMFLDLGRNAEIESILSDLYRLSEQHFGMTDPMTLQCLSLLNRSRLAQEKHNVALNGTIILIDRIQKASGKRAIQLVTEYKNVSNLLVRLGRLEEAYWYKEKEVDLAYDLFGEGDSRTIESMISLSRFLIAQNPNLALFLLKSTLDVVKDKDPSEEITKWVLLKAEILFFQGKAYENAEQSKDALECFQNSLKISKKVHGTEFQSDTLACFMHIARNPEMKKNHPEELEIVLKKIETIRKLRIEQVLKK